MKFSTKPLLIAFLSFAVLFTNAQNNDTIEIKRNEKGKVSFARFNPTINAKIQEGENFLKAILKTKPDDDLRLTKDTVDKLGIAHRLYQQYYKGVKVENAEFLIHGKNSIIEIINGDFQEVNLSSVVPVVNEQQALNTALKFVNARKYKWQDDNFEKFIKQNTKNPNATYYPKGEIVITKDLLKSGANLKLAWKFKISSLDPNDELLIYVDAFTNEAIRKTPLIQDANTPCIAETRYSGVVGITGDSFVGGFRLRESRNNVDVQTLNLHSTYDYGSATDFTNTTTNFTNGNWPTFNQDRHALDVHWGAENVLDYWRNVHNRNSIDGNGIRVLSYVHAGSNWNNAQWVGGPNNHFMQYGDGDGGLFNPLAALDICAHEFGHGITEFTAALVPGTQESGALNEGFSDIWGACVEHFEAPNKQTWLMGEEIFATTAFNCIRNLQNPKSTTAAEGQHPDTYHGQFWDNNGEPHTNSTVLSHWFFLLSQGGNGTNDIGNTFTVNGIGINDAQLIAFRAEGVYLNSTAAYTDARNATISSARDLFGAGSCQEIAATNAWYAVGVGAQYASPTTPVITGPDAICYNSTATYTLTNVPAGVTITWSASDSYRTVTPAANGLSATITNISSSSVGSFVSVSVNGCSGQLSTTKTIALGAPYVTGTYTNAYDGSTNYLGYYSYGIINPACTQYYINTNMTITGANSVTWNKIASNGVVSLEQNGNDIQFYLFYSGEYALFQIDASNGCGTTTNQFKWQASNCSTSGGGGCNAFTVSPNPTSGQVNIYPQNILPPCFTKSNPAITKSSLVINELRIYDNSKTLKRLIKTNNSTQVSINVHGLTPGSYYVEISANNNYKETQILIVQ